MSRRRPILGLVSFAVVLGVVAAACGDDATDVSVGAPPPPDPDRPVLVVDHEGGFMTPEGTFRSVPTMAVYADGRAITLGAVIMIYPGPALPPLFVEQLDDEGLARIEAAARDAGLDTVGLDFGAPPVADVPTTVLTVVVDGETYVHRIEALGIDDDPALTPDQQAARAAVGDFLGSVTNLAELAGEHVGAPEPYEAERFRLWIRPAAEYDEGRDPGIEPTVVAWTVDGVTLATADCVAAEGDVATEVGALFAEADDLTRFEAGGEVWAVVARPVLPHEATCPPS